jgi:hypothetical protein
MRFDPFSAGPSVRIGFLESANWLFALVALGVVTAIWGVVMGARRLFERRSSPDRPAAMALDGLCLVWLIAFGLAAVGAAALGSPNTAVFSFPGPLLPATALAAIAVIGPLRPAGWRAWRWTREAAVLAIFAALSATLYAWGLLGYSGW